MLIGTLLFGLSLFGIAGAVWAKSYALLVGPLVLWGCVMPMLYVPTRRAVMAVVPAAEHGEAGGINLTAQLLGGTIGMAVCGTLLAMTGDYRVVFLTSGVLAIVVLFIVWFTVEHPADSQPTR